MKLVMPLEMRFEMTPDGAVWTGGAYPYAFWQRYLDVFDGVEVFARATPVAEPAPQAQRADGDAVSFAIVPHYLGPAQYLRRAGAVKRALRAALAPDRAIILRSGGQLGLGLMDDLRRMGRPYGLEVIGDPHDVFAPGVVTHPLRPLLRWWFTRQVRRQCQGAGAALYVGAALQQRYPTAPGAFATVCSDVVLPEAALAAEPRPVCSGGPMLLVMVGSLSQLYKCPDVLIEAVAQACREGLDLRLTFVGDGKFRGQLEAQAAALGIAARVRFPGQLPAGEAVRAQLDAADLFVLPSRAEGLPRAMVEAMGRGLPCIGSRVGCIPELLPEEDLVSPGDAAALAAKIREVVTDPARLARMSARNLAQAREYRDEALQPRRRAFYEYVRNRTEAWRRDWTG